MTTQINQALTLAQKQFGDGSLTADLDLIEGRCTAGDGGPTGTSTLTNAKLAASFGGQSITLLDFPTHPAPNTHLITDLSKVLTLVLEGVRTDLQNSLQGQAAPLQAVIDQIENNVVTHIHDQVEANLKPLEDNVLDITLNQQVHPTRDSIKVRALDVQVLPAAKSQLGGSSLVNLQVGNAACAPVARVAVSAPQPQAAPPHKALPTAVSAGLASAPGQSAPQSDNHVALAALAMMLAGGTALVAIRWLRA